MAVGTILEQTIYYVQIKPDPVTSSDKHVWAKIVTHTRFYVIILYNLENIWAAVGGGVAALY